ncbi:MAG: hypothetical protein FK733_05095 [Asgard group archaeon]|nr:hypothetical protein [Asgard group archaeon]
MKRKAVGIIILYLSLMFSLPISIYIQSVNTENVQMDDVEIVIDNLSPEKEFKNMLNVVVNSKGTESQYPLIQTPDFTSPSYTNVTLSEANPVIEGTNVVINSRTTSSGHGVSSGQVDFKDLILEKIDDDSTSDVIYSNKYAIGITLQQETTIEGFVVDITPTIREDINFYIRTSLVGTNLRSGVISGNIASSAHTTDQLLYIPFSYCGGLPALTLAAGTTYYFIIEPSVSTVDTFFELQEAADAPDDVDVYEWYNNDFEVYYTDVNFYLIIDEITIENSVTVSVFGEASTNWNALPQGDHTILSWYYGAVVYSESYGTRERTVIPSTEIIQVSLDPVTTQYKDVTALSASLLDEMMLPAADKTVTFSYSPDGSDWTTIGTAISDINGYAILNYAFDLYPDSYILKAYVNDFSFDTNSLDISPENLVFETIDFHGRFRNNPGMATFTKINAVVLVKDDDGNPVPDTDIELWYKYDGEYEWIPHFYTTNSSGYLDIEHAVEDLLVGNHPDTHYFVPASYEVGYQGISAYGNSIVDKGLLDLITQDYVTKWNDNLQLVTQVLSIGDAWEGITIEYSYYADSQWHSLGTCVSNNTGFAVLLWAQMPLTYGSYQIRAHAYESQYFEEAQEENSLVVDRQDLNVYIIKSGEMKGNGEEIDLEYTSTMYLTFYVAFGDGTPASNIVLSISGRPINDVFFMDMGFTTTNESGYAHFNNYENITLVGNQYLCVVQIDQNDKHEEANLHFKINLLQCTPIVYLEDHLCEKGTSTEIVIFVFNSENLPLSYVQVQLNITGTLYYGISDQYGFIRITIAPDLPVGRYQITCHIIEDYRYKHVEVLASLVMSKGTPQFTLFEAYAIVDGYLTITAQALDLIGRAIPGLTVQISFIGWSEFFTTDAYGFIEYTFKLEGFETGYYLSILTFNGNSDWFDTMTTGTVLIYEEESELELLTTSISCTYGEEVFLEAQLTDQNGSPLENRLVVFILAYANGTTITLGQNTTDVQGYASLRLMILVEPGSYDLFAKYPGAVDYGPSYGITSFVIQKVQVMILGSDFDAIINSTTTFGISIIDIYGWPISYEQLNVYIWVNNSWIPIGSFLTDQYGIATITFPVQYSYGVYILKIEFTGNEYYTSNYLNLDMTVVEPPPKINPNIIISTEATTFVDFEIIQFNVQVSNALTGTTLTIQVFIDGIYNGSMLIINGYGQYLWSTAELGIYIVTFVSVTDSVYLETSEEITIEIIQNAPPELIGYSYSDYIGEGEPFSIEATFFDASGIDQVWIIINGTYYELIFNGVAYNTTIYNLKQGIYNTTLCAVDNQGYLSLYELSPLNVFAKKTQMIKYHINSRVLEYGQELYFEVLVYSINSLSNVYFILNSTEYLMLLGYQINEHFSVWYIYLESLPIGNYEIEIKIIETTSYTVVNKISELVQVIPIAPELSYYEWYMSKSGESDYIYGNLTFDSYYAIHLVEIWLDGQRITVTKISDELFSFSGYVSHSKSHTMKVQVSDIMGRVNIDELLLGKAGLSVLIIASVAVTIVVVIAIIGIIAVFTIKQKRSSSDESFISEIDVLEIDDDENFETLTTDRRTPLQLTDSESPNNILGSLSPPSINGVAVSGDMFEIDENSIDEDLESIEINPEPNFAQVKEYIAKVREDGLIPNNGSKVKKSIDDLATLSIEIDYRLLPEKERQKKLAEIEEAEAARVMNLKDIAEEIDETFSKKK